MNAYADTGFLCSLMAPDANTAAAVKRMKIQELPLAWTWIHDLEFRNALRLRRFRKEMSEAEADNTLRILYSDFADGVYLTCDPTAPHLRREAERLSATHTAKVGTRALDVLHVAAALVLGVDLFLTFDKRQAVLARAAGLSVPKL